MEELFKSGTFAEACYHDNSPGQLVEALREEPDISDMEEWGIDADEWRYNIVLALSQRIEDQIARLEMRHEDVGPVQCLAYEVQDDGNARVWDDGASFSGPADKVIAALKAIRHDACPERFWEGCALADLLD